MKVLFLRDVSGVADWGDTKEVADGYAWNYLFPNKLAVAATPQILKEFEARKEKIAKEASVELKHVQSTASGLDGYEIEVAAKINPEGKLYGGIGPQKIAQVLKGKGFNVKKTQIIFPEGSIKEPGTHKAIVKFEHNLEAEIRISVVEEF